MKNSLLCFISVISLFVASSYSIKREKIDGNPVKCLRIFFDGYQGALNWVINQSIENQNNFDKWHSKMLDKTYKENGKISE